MDDETAVLAECEAAYGNHEISDGCARTIGAMYHEGGNSISATFATTGAIIGDSSHVWRELRGDGYMSPAWTRAFDMLGTYLINREDRGPVEGWSNVWVGR